MEKKLSKLDLKIVDFTTRLPGPLAGSILADLGAQVTRAEIEGQEDPFLFSQDEPIFKCWANNLSKNKKSVRFGHNEQEKIDSLISASDVVLCPPADFYRKLMAKHERTLFIEVMGGSGPQKYLHDLNALFLTRSFKLQLAGHSEPSLPYLPIAGVIFAQQIALEAMAGRMQKLSDPKAPNRKVYLDRAAKNVLDKLWCGDLEGSGPEDGERLKFLHNGKFPCYNIYKTKDGGFVGLAAVESRFWSEFTEIFGLGLNKEDRFDSSGKTGQKLKEMFLNYKASEILNIIGGRDICVNVFASKEKE